MAQGTPPHATYIQDKDCHRGLVSRSFRSGTFSRQNCLTRKQRGGPIWWRDALQRLLKAGENLTKFVARCADASVLQVEVCATESPSLP